jgi:hypothetical protein
MDDTMSDNQKFNVIQLDWRWLVVTYCFLVLFHLLPSLLMSSLWQFFFGKGIWRFSIWAWSGMVIVAAYIGYRSNTITLLASGVASMLYMATLIPTMSDIRGVHASGARIIGLLVALHLISFLFGCLGAVIGLLIRRRKEIAASISDGG